VDRMTVRSAGHDLHVVTAGDARHPTVLFLHGYPDSHRVWREAMEALSDGYRVVSYDMRGVADSAPPAPSREYRLERLAADVDAVLDAVCGHGTRAHLVGHDWGSTLAWHYVADPERARRVLSLTSISGPHLGITTRWIRDGFTGLRPRQMATVAKQLLKSSYVLFFSAWPLAELFWWVGGAPAWRFSLRRAGVPHGDPMLDEPRERVLSLTLRPLALYRRNLWRSNPPPPEGSITVPVLLLLATADPFVSEAVFDDLERYATRVTRRRVNASHWAQRSNPEELLALLRDFLRAQEETRA